MRLRHLIALATVLLASGCAGIDVKHTPDTKPAMSAPALSNNGPFDLEDTPVPSLDEAINLVPSASEEPQNDEDRLRAPAMRDAALSYGARAGLAWTSRDLNETLKKHAAEMSETYAFEQLLIAGSDGVAILPPVISEARETWESFEAGKALRVADTVYEIIEQARFTPVAPLWQSYLLRSYTAPEPPNDALLPKTDGERDAWRRWVTEGWMMGVRQAREIFQADLNRLERDLTGMIRYKALLEEGKVTPPVVAEGRLGVTGTGQDMRVNDRAIRITRDPVLQLDPSQWNATVSPPARERADTVSRSVSEPAVPADREKRRRW